MIFRVRSTHELAYRLFMMSPLNKWQESSTRVDQSIILAHSNVPCNNDYAHSFNDIENVQSFNKLQRNCFFLVHALISCIHKINSNVHVLVQFFFTYLLRVKRAFGRPCKQRVTSLLFLLQKNGGVFGEVESLILDNKDNPTKVNFTYCPVAPSAGSYEQHSLCYSAPVDNTDNTNNIETGN